MESGPQFDVLLHGGRVICPASGIDGVMDVAVRGGRIAAVQSSILPTSAKEVIDARGQIVLPGLIDTHAHVYQYVTGRFGMNADMVGVQSGVTTLVDQGGPSCMTLPGFRHFIAEPAQSRVVAFLSAYLVGGLEGHYYPNLYSPDCVDIGATVKAARANRDSRAWHPGVHAEIGGFARWGIRVIEMAAEIKQAGRSSGLRPFRPALGVAGERQQWRGRRHHPRAGHSAPAQGRHPGPSVHASSRRLRQSRGRGAHRHPGCASIADCSSMSAMAATFRIGWRARRSMPASCRPRSARTYTATIPMSRRLPARPTSTPTMRTILSPVRRASRWCRR